MLGFVRLKLLALSVQECLALPCTVWLCPSGSAWFLSVLECLSVLESLALCVWECSTFFFFFGGGVLGIVCLRMFGFLGVLSFVCLAVLGFVLECSALSVSDCMGLSLWEFLVLSVWQCKVLSGSVLPCLSEAVCFFFLFFSGSSCLCLPGSARFYLGMLRLAQTVLVCLSGCSWLCLSQSVALSAWECSVFIWDCLQLCLPGSDPLCRGMLGFVCPGLFGFVRLSMLTLFGTES